MSGSDLVGAAFLFGVCGGTALRLITTVLRGLASKKLSDD